MTREIDLGIPFDKDGNMLSWGDEWRTKSRVPVADFVPPWELKFVEFTRGRSSVLAWMVETEFSAGTKARKFPVTLAEFEKIIPFMGSGFVTFADDDCPLEVGVAKKGSAWTLCFKEPK